MILSTVQSGIPLQIAAAVAPVALYFMVLGLLNTRSRPQMLDQLAEEIRKDAIELRDPVIIAQCKTFIMNPKNGKPEADENLLDDGVLATAISGAVIQEHPFKAKPKDAKSQEAVREAQKPMFAF